MLRVFNPVDFTDAGTAAAQGFALGVAEVRGEPLPKPTNLLALIMLAMVLARMKGQGHNIDEVLATLGIKGA